MRASCGAIRVTCMTVSLVLMCAFLSSCDNSVTEGIPDDAIEFKLEQLEHSDGYYSFPGIEWGMTEAAVIEALGLPEDASLRMSDDENRVWAKLVIGNKEYGGPISYSHYPRALSSNVVSTPEMLAIHISAVPTDYEAAYSAITKEMTRIYGEPTVIENKHTTNKGVTSQSKTWRIYTDELISIIDIMCIEGSTVDGGDVSGIRFILRCNFN